MNKHKIFLGFCILIFSTKNIAQKLPYDSIDRFVQQYMQVNHIPGCAVAILKDNTVVKMKGYGLASLEFDVPVTTKTKFLLDSQTKLFTAIAMMKLKEEGRIKLDEPINQYLDSIPASWSKVTIRNLLTHSSGIHDDYVPWYNGSSSMEYTEQELYHRALQQPLDFATGTRISYNNLGFFLATVLIEKVTHVPYQKFMTDSLFTPLGLNTISFAAQEQVVKNYATAYSLKNDTVVHMRDYAVSQQGFSYMMKASVEDLAKFDKLFNEEKVISKQSINEMRTLFVTGDNQVSNMDVADWFVGISYEVDFINGFTFYGKGGAAGTVYLQVPARHLTVILLSNMEHAHQYNLAVHIARLADTALRNNPNLLKDINPSRTKQMQLFFTDYLLNKLDSSQLNPKFFAYFFSAFYNLQNKSIQQLHSFTYDAEYEMNDKNLFLFGEHVNRVVAYNVKFAELNFLLFYYLSDAGKILFMEGEPV